jgi:hypothetical protein
MDDLLALMTPVLRSSRVRVVDRTAVLCDDGVWHDALASVGDLRCDDEVLVCVVPGRARGVVVGRIGAQRESLPPPEVVIAAGASLALRCGEAALLLRSDGKAVLSGVDVATRARRMNRITGGAVAIN